MLINLLNEAEGSSSASGVGGASSNGYGIEVWDNVLLRSVQEGKWTLSMCMNAHLRVNSCGVPVTGENEQSNRSTRPKGGVPEFAMGGEGRWSWPEGDEAAGAGVSTFVVVVRVNAQYVVDARLDVRVFVVHAPQQKAPPCENVHAWIEVTSMPKGGEGDGGVGPGRAAADDCGNGVLKVS